MLSARAEERMSAIMMRTYREGKGWVGYGTQQDHAPQVRPQLCNQHHRKRNPITQRRTKRSLSVPRLLGCVGGEENLSVGKYKYNKPDLSRTNGNLHADREGRCFPTETHICHAIRFPFCDQPKN